MFSIGIALESDEGGNVEESVVKGIGEAISGPRIVTSLLSTSDASTSSSSQYRVFAPSTNVDQYKILRQLVPDTAAIGEEDGQDIRLLCKFFGPIQASCSCLACRLASLQHFLDPDSADPRSSRRGCDHEMETERGKIGTAHIR